MRIVAYSSTSLVGYRGYVQPSVQVSDEETGSHWSATIDLTELSDPQHDQKVHLFYPFTTTLIEIKLTRVALLVDGVSKLAHFVNAVERRALLKASEKAAEERERDRKYAEGSMRRDELLTKLEEDHRKSKQT